MPSGTPGSQSIKSWKHRVLFLSASFSSGAAIYLPFIQTENTWVRMFDFLRPVEAMLCYSVDRTYSENRQNADQSGSEPRNFPL